MYLNQWERVQSESLLDESPIITCKNLKVINNLTKKSNDNQKPHQMIQSLTNNIVSSNKVSNLKNEVFLTIYRKKNLIKQGLHLLEIFQNAAGSTDLATDRRGHDGPSLTPSSHTCAIPSIALFITLDVKYDGPS